ncbi:hypothetical protein WICPIJ_002591 [Wickerhamomyces pijperi]|uniref:Uncharacterized protein n=1 Tax=Wickerhamomyces pijperi TaxID=599730 RepID=A0A9P8QBD0_WICPI|nr:hypothetical protein WICPIJ_002591 [Wickerhamomyces pijperi]
MSRELEIPMRQSLDCGKQHQENNSNNICWLVVINLSNSSNTTMFISPLLWPFKTCNKTSLESCNDVLLAIFGFNDLRISWKIIDVLVMLIQLM